MKKPVVIVPGFAASELKTKGGLLRPQTVYYAPTYSVLFGIDDLDLAPDGVSPGPLSSGPLDATNVWESQAFAGLMNVLNTSTLYPVLWPYDWRLSVLRSGKALSEYLQSSFGGSDFYVVAHSMGGLVARVAYSEYRKTSPATNWKRSVYIGTPHGGSHWPGVGLSGGIRSDSLLSIVANVLGGLNVADIRRITSGEALLTRAKRVIASWPAFYELLPNLGSQWAGLDPHAAQMFDRANYVAENSAVTQARLDDAKATHVVLDGLLTSARPPEVNVIGTKHLTPDKLLFANALISPTSYSFTERGDDAVSVERATLTGVAALTVEAAHSDLISAPTVLQQLAGIVLNSLPQNKFSPNPPLVFVRDEQPPSTIDLPIKPFNALVRRGDP